MDPEWAGDVRLPSTASLRVFAAVAKLGSTTKAARLVNLTQSAVSKQVLLLEETLGCALFERTPQGLVLTQAGEIFRPYADAALEQLQRGRRRMLENVGQPSPLRLHMLAIVGERWLMPRFQSFVEQHPDIDVQFTNYVSEHESEVPDVQIQHGTGDWPARQAWYLFGRDIALVASPGLIEKQGGCLALEDIQRLTLLQHFQAPAYCVDRRAKRPPLAG